MLSSTIWWSKVGNGVRFACIERICDVGGVGGGIEWGGWASSAIRKPSLTRKTYDLIGSIYDCALDPTKWVFVLAAISRELFFSSRY